MQFSQKKNVQRSAKERSFQRKKISCPTMLYIQKLLNILYDRIMECSTNLLQAEQPKSSHHCRSAYQTTWAGTGCLLGAVPVISRQ
jgi:hypothetical protein